MAAKKTTKSGNGSKKSGGNGKAKKGAARKPSTPDMTELVDLTPEAALALPRPRDKFEDHVEPLFTLYTSHQDVLGTLTTEVDEGRARYARYQDLAGDEKAARDEVAAANKKLEMVLETRALQASKVWSVMLDIYGRAKQAGKNHADIAEGIKPFTRFMSTGPRKGNGE